MIEREVVVLMVYQASEEVWEGRRLGIPGPTLQADCQESVERLLHQTWTHPALTVSP